MHAKHLLPLAAALALSSCTEATSPDLGAIAQPGAQAAASKYLGHVTVTERGDSLRFSFSSDQPLFAIDLDTVPGGASYEFHDHTVRSAGGTLAIRRTGSRVELSVALENISPHEPQMGWAITVGDADGAMTAYEFGVYQFRDHLAAR
jgi:hypothetical protein